MILHFGCFCSKATVPQIQKGQKIHFQNQMISSGLWKMGSWKITLINKGMAYQKQFETLRKMALKICQTWIQKRIYDYKKKSYKIAKEQRQLQVKNRLPGRLGTASHQLNWNCYNPQCRIVCRLWWMPKMHILNTMCNIVFFGMLFTNILR